MITLNGEPLDGMDGKTVSELVAQLGYNPARIAVELDLDIVKKTDYDTAVLKDGNKIEIVHFVGGG